MKRPFESAFRDKAIRGLAIAVLSVSVVFVLLVLSVIVLLDYEGLAEKHSFLDTIKDQTVAIVLLSVMYLVALAILWLRRRRAEAAGSVSDVRGLIAKGEGEFLEFKASLRWDYREGHVSKDLEYTIAKTVSSFMNAAGGALLIGVNDDATILGLAADYQTLKKQSKDGFLLHLTNVLNSHLGKEHAEFVSVQLHTLDGNEVCALTIAPATKPVYLRHNGQEEFFIRSSASTQPLSIREAHEYIRAHWEQ